MKIKMKKTFYVTMLMVLLSVGVQSQNLFRSENPCLSQDYYLVTKDEGVVPISGYLIDSVKIEAGDIHFYRNGNIPFSKSMTNVTDILFDFTPTPAYPNNIAHKPGIVEAEYFDIGGEGIAYHDNSPENGGDANFRMDEGVDIYHISNPPNGNYFIGWNGGGEWLKYTINAPVAGTYHFAFHVGTAAAVYIDLLIDEQPPVRVNFYNTGWGWSKIEGPDVELSAGNHVVTVRFTDGGMNYDKFEFNKK
jgi:hypothetical protein